MHFVNRPVHIVNYKTGQVIKTKSVTDACAKINADRTIKDAVTNNIICHLLDGRVHCAKDFVLPKFYKKLSEVRTFYHYDSGFTGEFTGSFLQLRDKLGMNVAFTKRFLEFMSGELTMLEGYYRSKSDLDAVLEGRKYHFRLSSGIIVSGYNQKDLAKQLGISYYSTNLLVTGQRPSCKGIVYLPYSPPTR